jgi:cell division GTPase FtsZ
VKLCHLCTDVCRKTRKASTSDASDAQQRTCITIRSITDLLMIDELICLDFMDVSSVMRDSGRGVVGIGEAAGEGRAIKTAEAAILVDVKRQLAVMQADRR